MNNMFGIKLFVAYSDRVYFAINPAILAGL